MRFGKLRSKNAAILRLRLEDHKLRGVRGRGRGGGGGRKGPWPVNEGGSSSAMGGRGGSTQSALGPRHTSGGSRKCLQNCTRKL